MGDRIDAVLDALTREGCRPTRQGEAWSACCPAHDDRNPSLSIGVGADARVLLHCHAGCAVEAILGALGLTLRELMPAPIVEARSLPALSREPKSGSTFPTADEAIAAYERTHGPCAARWTYTDTTGEPVGEVLRWNPPTGGKVVRPICRRGDGWAMAAMPEPRPLLHLPELSHLPDGALIYVVEGETCVDAARALRLVATTSAGGSKAAGKSDWSAMKGKVVVIFPDNDPAGVAYAEDVARQCRAAGAQEVHVVRLADHWPGLAPGGDLVDVVAMDGDDVEALKAKLDALALANAPVIEDEPVPDCPESPPTFNPAALFPDATGDICDFFADLARSTQTPPEMAALLGLAVGSACICNVACIRGHGDHIEPAPLWALVLSEPGTRKSAVLTELLRPILKWEADKGREMRPLIAAAAQRHRIAERRIRALEDQASRNDNPLQRAAIEGDAILLAQEKEATPVPTSPALLACEPTPEALVRQMKDNHGRALLASAEGDALDIVQGRYSGVRNYGALLKGHAGDPYRAHRIGRPSDVIDRPALAVALCVQRAAVEAVWCDPQAEGRGLLARFAVIAPPDLVGTRDVRPEQVAVSAREAWHSAITRLLSFEPSDDPNVDPVAIALSPEADAVYHAFQLRNEAALGLGDLAERRAWGGKLCGLSLRFALTLHALATWGRTNTPADATHIDVETMASAIAWADYLAASELHARLSIIEPPEGRVMKRHLALISRHGGSVSIREWQRLRSLRRATDAEAELDAMVNAGHGMWSWHAPGARGGRPSRRFTLNGHAIASDTSPPTPAAHAPDGPQGGVSSVSSVSGGEVRAPID
ncbi:MAG: DUF3987 domain-containing protein [Phycisphaeraceae bacterium]|nr:DUF3987 domain-containing protein [Phycisphaeraceae bacterium]MCW5763660.1 DUF3987 domain-containing protein [Phycisphaeraceae bacterium]